MEAIITTNECFHCFSESCKNNYEESLFFDTYWFFYPILAVYLSYFLSVYIKDERWLKRLDSFRFYMTLISIICFICVKSGWI